MKPFLRAMRAREGWNACLPALRIRLVIRSEVRQTNSMCRTGLLQAIAFPNRSRLAQVGSDLPSWVQRADQMQSLSGWRGWTRWPSSFYDLFYFGISHVMYCVLEFLSLGFCLTFLSRLLGHSRRGVTIPLQTLHHPRMMGGHCSLKLLVWVVCLACLTRDAVQQPDAISDLAPL